MKFTDEVTRTPVFTIKKVTMSKPGIPEYTQWLVLKDGFLIMDTLSVFSTKEEAMQKIESIKAPDMPWVYVEGYYNDKGEPLTYREPLSYKEQHLTIPNRKGVNTFVWKLLLGGVGLALVLVLTRGLIELNNLISSYN